MWETTKLMNEIKELNEWRDFSCSRLGKLNIVKLSILPILGMLLMRERLCTRGSRDIWEISAPLPQFCCEPYIALKE